MTASAAVLFILSSVATFFLAAAFAGLVVPRPVAAGAVVVVTLLMVGFVRAKPIHARSEFPAATDRCSGDKTYHDHAPSLVQWMLSGRIDLAPLSYQSYYPFNADLLSLWFMMPFGNGAAVALTGLVYAGMLIAVSLEFGRRWNLPLWSQDVPAVPLPSSIEIVGQCNRFADVNPSHFLANLRKSKLDFVVTPSMPHRDGARPCQYDWLSSLNLPISSKSSDAVIWDLRPTTIAAASDL